MKRSKRIATALLISFFVLSACSLPVSFGNGEEEGSAQTAEAVEEAVTPTEEEAIPVTAATPTAAEPAAQPTETEAAAEVAPETAANGACSHPYYPVLPDTTWHYRSTTTGLPTIDQYFTYEEITADSFVSKQRIEGETTTDLEATWLCKDDGLLNVAYGLVTFMDLPGDFTFETVEYEGVSLPLAEEWVVGKEWTGNWHIKGEADIAGVGTTVSDIDVVQENRIVAVESVTVPAGTYDEAVRVDSTVTLELTTTVGETSMPGMTTDFSLSAWYVEGVGMVKQSSADTEWGFEMELIAME